MAEAGDDAAQLRLLAQERQTRKRRAAAAAAASQPNEAAASQPQSARERQQRKRAAESPNERAASRERGAGRKKRHRRATAAAAAAAAASQPDEAAAAAAAAAAASPNEGADSAPAPPLADIHAFFTAPHPLPGEVLHEQPWARSQILACHRDMAAYKLRKCCICEEARPTTDSRVPEDEAEYVCVRCRKERPRGAAAAAHDDTLHFWSRENNLVSHALAGLLVVVVRARAAMPLTVRCMVHAGVCPIGRSDHDHDRRGAHAGRRYGRGQGACAQGVTCLPPQAGRCGLRADLLEGAHDRTAFVCYMRLDGG